MGGRAPQIPAGRKVRSVYSKDWSHVALLDNGSIVAWGDLGDGGDGGRTPQIPEGRTVRSVSSNHRSHVAILDNGSVVAWGDPDHGGCTPQIPEGRTISCNYGNNASISSEFPPNGGPKF